MRLDKVDLNLFLIFNAIYQERNLTKVAEKLNLSQPTISNALARLRKSLDDPLFIRTSAGMQPTPCADNMIGNVRIALELMAASINQKDEFDPYSSECIFRTSMTDLASVFLLPPLIKRFSTFSEHLSIQNYYIPREEILNKLTNGHLDLAVEAPYINSKDLCHKPLFHEKYICLVRKGHPLFKNDQNLSLEKYLNLKHIHVSSRFQGLGHIDLYLTEKGLSRNIQLQTEHYAAAYNIMQRTDLALTAPWNLSGGEALALELPFKPISLDLHLYWHKRVSEDPKSIWLRKMIQRIANTAISF